MRVKVPLTLCMLYFSVSSYALFPVIDITSIAKMSQELSVMENTYKSEKNQLSSMTGSYGFQDIINSSSDTKARQWSPDSWKDALRKESGGNDARYQQLVNSYEEHHKIMSQQTMESMTSTQQAQDYTDTANVNRASTANAEHAFNDINEKIKEVYSLSQKIKSAPNEKAALDLNNRLVAEMAYIQLQMLKMQAVTNMQISQTQANQLSTQAQKANFDQLPKE